MKEDKYAQGREICEKLFKETGDLRYHNMMVGFENFQKEYSQENEENGREL